MPRTPKPRSRPGHDPHRAATDTELAAAVHGPPGRSWGWAAAGAGRCAHIDPGRIYQGTTVQVCGLYPYLAGSGAPPYGVPLGPHLLTREVVCLEPFAWLERGLVTNTGAMVLGQPGAGKSTIVKRLLTGSVAYGIRGLVLGEPKGEYSRLTEHLGGQVVRVGPGMDRINPLDCGPLAQLAATAPIEAARTIAQEIRARRLAILRSLVLLARGSNNGGITEAEDLALGGAVDILADRSGPGRQPTIGQVLGVIHEGPPQVRSATYATSTSEYGADTRGLVKTLAMLGTGSLSGILDTPTTHPVDLDAPVVSLDISRLQGMAEDTVAAAMLATWSHGLAMCSAARWAAELGQRPPTRWVTVMDEMWRALRAASGLVEVADQLTRLGRSWGMASVMVTHSLDDLQALPTETDRAKARGLVERCAITVMAALSERELADVAAICPMTSAERAMIAGWAAPSAGTDSDTHPGRGKYMIKVGERTGIPVQLDLVGAEPDLYDTDQATRTATTATTGGAR